MEEDAETGTKQLCEPFNRKYVVGLLGGISGRRGKCVNGGAVKGRAAAKKKHNRHWRKLKIKYDVRHFEGRFLRMARSKSSPVFKYFASATADAVLKLQKGERKRVLDHLRRWYRLRYKDMEDSDIERKLIGILCP